MEGPGSGREEAVVTMMVALVVFLKNWRSFSMLQGDNARRQLVELPGRWVREPTDRCGVSPASLQSPPVIGLK